jgi:hypothetical protein
MTAAMNWRSDPATELQVEAIHRRLGERQLSSDRAKASAARAQILALVAEGMTKGEANQLITWLDKQPRTSGIKTRSARVLTGERSR